MIERESRSQAKAAERKAREYAYARKAANEAFGQETIRAAPSTYVRIATCVRFGCVFDTMSLLTSDVESTTGGRR
jgi:hypothetical protein